MCVLPNAHRDVIQPSLVHFISSEEKLNSLTAFPFFSQFPSLCFCESARAEVDEFALKAGRCPVPSLFADIHPHPCDHPYERGVKIKDVSVRVRIRFDERKVLTFLLAAAFKRQKWEEHKQLMGGRKGSRWGDKCVLTVINQ